MKKRYVQKFFSLLAALCLAFGACAGAVAEAQPVQTKKANVAEF